MASTGERTTHLHRARQVECLLWTWPGPSGLTMDEDVESKGAPRRAQEFAVAEVSSCNSEHVFLLQLPEDMA
jgi:hypothetical protein